MKIYLFTFCVFIGRHSKPLLTSVLKMLESSLKVHNDFELHVFKNFPINHASENIVYHDYFTKSKVYKDKWLNLSFNKIDMYKHLYDKYDGKDFVWIDLDTLVTGNIEYLNEVDNVFVEIGGQQKTKNALFTNNHTYTVPRNRYIQGNFWKLNIKLYDELIKTFENDIKVKNLKLRYDLQDLFSYYIYHVCKDDPKTNGINILGNNYKPDVIGGLSAWGTTKHAISNGSLTDVLYKDSNVLKTKLYPNKEIHILSFTFHKLKKVMNLPKFKELLL